MSASLRPLLLEEFLSWERTQPERFEFDGIQPVAMIGGPVADARLIRRVVMAIAPHLPPGCEAFGGDLKVLTTCRARYPDATVVCGLVDPDADAVEPSIAIEVLSPSTALTDRRVKAGDYAGLDSVLAYVMFEQDDPVATVLRRSTGWREETFTGPDAIVPLPEISIEMPLGAPYP